ncbi:MAG: cytidylate kinase-like family protein, partial [Bryobacteraceae bacterium]
MNVRVLTIAREYGSGGGEIARIVASRLGWTLVDQALLAKVASKANVPAGSVADLDEQVDPWLYRIMRRLWGTGADGYSAITPPVKLVDADAVAALTRQVIQEAHVAGRCVIVGRGAQCVLRGKTDVFHAFVYADWSDRVQRIHSRLGPDIDAAEIIRSMDVGRLDYVRHHYGVNRLDRHLYDLLVRSRNHTDEVARLILSAME